MGFEVLNSGENETAPLGALNSGETDRGERTPLPFGGRESPNFETAPLGLCQKGQRPPEPDPLSRVAGILSVARQANRMWVLTKDIYLILSLTYRKVPLCVICLLQHGIHPLKSAPKNLSNPGLGIQRALRTGRSFAPK